MDQTFIKQIHCESVELESRSGLAAQPPGGSGAKSSCKGLLL